MRTPGMSTLSSRLSHQETLLFRFALAFLFIFALLNARTAFGDGQRESGEEPYNVSQQIQEARREERAARDLAREKDLRETQPDVHPSPEVQQCVGSDPATHC